jgi:hypothetical protein
MSATDDYKIALNIVAKLGINHPDFMKEFAKSKNMLHQFDSFNAVQQHKKAHGSPVQPLGGTPMGQGGVNAPATGLNAQNPADQLNQPMTPPVSQTPQEQGGGTALNLPPQNA